MRDWTELKQWAEGLQHCPEHYDMPAEVVRLVMADLLALMAENAKLREVISEAADDIEGWGNYASDYFAEKHDLIGCIQRYRDISEGKSDD